MKRRSRSARFGVRTGWVLVVLATGLVVTSTAHAQNRNRRPSAAQRAAMKKMQEQMQAYQKDMARYQKEMADKNAEIAKRFDENGDGKLFGAERSKYDKYVYAVQNGKEPNPFADIKPPGQGPAMTAAKK